VSDRFSSYFDSLIDALRITEAEEKKRYDSAIDIEDMAEATSVTIDARTKIQHLRKWTEDLLRLRDEIVDTFSERILPDEPLPAIEPQAAQQTIEPLVTSKDINDISSKNIGEYIRQKMYALSQSGYVFTEEQLKDLQTATWSRDVLHIPHAFARVYDENKDLLEQTSINGIPRRYWVGYKFTFGNVTLLIYSGWAPMYKQYFDQWYDSLPNNAQTGVDVVITDEDISDIDTADDTGANWLSTTNDSGEDSKHLDYEPAEISLFGKTYTVQSWKDVLVKLCEMIILREPYKAAGFGHTMNPPNRIIFSFDEAQIDHDANMLSNGLYIDTGGTGNDIYLICERILSVCGYSTEELQINVTEDK
jgi:hypothetical protein